MRHQVRPLHGLLHDPDLHPVQSDRRHLVGVLLAQPQRITGSRLSGRHHRLDHDDAHVVHQRRLAQNLLRQVYRHLLGHLLHHGLRLAARSDQRLSFVFIRFFLLSSFFFFPFLSVFVWFGSSAFRCLLFTPSVVGFIR